MRSLLLFMPISGPGMKMEADILLEVVTYQNKVCCWEKFYLVSDKKNSLVFENSHQTVLQKRTHPQASHNYKINLSGGADADLEELSSCMSIHCTEWIIKQINICILINCTGNLYPLLLTSTHIYPSFSDLC